MHWCSLHWWSRQCTQQQKGRPDVRLGADMAAMAEAAVEDSVLEETGAVKATAMEAGAAAEAACRFWCADVADVPFSAAAAAAVSAETAAVAAAAAARASR